MNSVSMVISANKQLINEYVMNKRECKEYLKVLKETELLESEIQRVSTFQPLEGYQHQDEDAIHSLNQDVQKLDPFDVDSIKQFTLFQAEQTSTSQPTQEFSLKIQIPNIQPNIQTRSRQRQQNKLQQQKTNHLEPQEDLISLKTEKKLTEDNKVKHDHQQKINKKIITPDGQGITSSESEKEDTEERKYRRQIKQNHTKTVFNNTHNIEGVHNKQEQQIKQRVQPKREAPKKHQPDDDCIQLIAYQTYKQNLMIHSAYPCDSLVKGQKERQKNVDLCPISADVARQKIQSRGQQLIGWYHSHPFFPVEPSQIDIRNHAIYQQNFDLEKLPFVAMIIGPYSVKSRTESLLKVFHLANGAQPYSLDFKQMPSTKLRKSLIKEFKELFIKYNSHQDTINMKETWSGLKTREDKLKDLIRHICDKNLEINEKFNVNQEIVSNLNQQDVNMFFNRSQVTSSLESSNEASNTQKSFDRSEEVNTLEKQKLEKEKYFSINSDEKINKFHNKINKNLQKYFYATTQNEEHRVQAYR